MAFQSFNTTHSSLLPPVTVNQPEWPYGGPNNYGVTGNTQDLGGQQFLGNMNNISPSSGASAYGPSHGASSFHHQNPYATASYAAMFAPSCTSEPVGSPGGSSATFYAAATAGTNSHEASHSPYKLDFNAMVKDEILAVEASSPSNDSPTPSNKN